MAGAMRFGRRVAVGAVAAVLAGCGAMPSGGGWQTLISGSRGMENFTPVGSANWRAESDGIVADSRSGGSHFLLTRQSYKDVQIRAEFWVSEDGNSGLYMRCTDARPVTDRTCHEANIFDRRPDPSFATGAIVWLARAPTPVPLTGGRWNTMEVTLKGTRMTVVLNGVKTAESNELRDAAGPIGLQYAGGYVKFRKVEVRGI